MPYPEGFNHYTNHPGWTKKKEVLAHQRKEIIPEEGKGIRIFRNAVEYIRKSF